MAINSGIPNQDGIATTYIYTGVAAVGAPGPASSQGAGTIKAYSLPAASNSNTNVPPVTTTIPNVPVMQILGESHELEPMAGGIVTPGIFADITASAPTAGQAPTPAPTVKVASAAAATGQQPAVTTPFTQSGWATKSTV